MFLSFGRADNAKIFQKVAETIIKALMIRFPELFTLNAEQIAQLERFRHIAPIEEDLWTAINYLDDQIFDQFVHLIGDR